MALDPMAGGIALRNRKYRLKTYRQCFGTYLRPTHHRALETHPRTLLCSADLAIVGVMVSCQTWTSLWRGWWPTVSACWVVR